MNRRLEDATVLWSLTVDGLVAETATSHVYRVTRSDGAPAVLKLLTEYGADEIFGAGLMRWYAGRGAARIFDIAENMILMEWLGGKPLGDLARSGHDDEATITLCNVIAELHRPRAGAPTNLVPLRDKFRALYESSPGMWPPTHRELAFRTITLADELFASAPSAIPLHGDCHHDNIIGSDRGWLAIDPKGLIGDPAYETANAFRNPFGASNLARQPSRIDRLASSISVNLGLDRTRVLKWAAAHSALSACWDAEAGNSVEWDLIMLPLLLGAVDRLA